MIFLPVAASGSLFVVNLHWQFACKIYKSVNRKKVSFSTEARRFHSSDYFLGVRSPIKMILGFFFRRFSFAHVYYYQNNKLSAVNGPSVVSTTNLLSYRFIAGDFFPLVILLCFLCLFFNSPTLTIDSSRNKSINNKFALFFHRILPFEMLTVNR